MNIPGYIGKMIRIDLTTSQSSIEELNTETLKKWVGGVGLGAKILYDEIPAGVEWSDPENRIILTTGPLSGSGVFGAGTFNVVTKGPMTNMAGSSQANGYFGAYLKFSGFDGVILQGKATNPVYLLFKDGNLEIRDAGHLAGTNVQELEDLLRKELGAKEKEISVYGIGPAGENGVRYSVIMGDRGHAASKNGIGAVMGSKKIKAMVAYKAKRNFEVKNPELLMKKNNASYKKTQEIKPWIERGGTGGGFSALHDGGILPVKNYTTNIYPEHEKMGGNYLRETYKIRSKPCYLCKLAHVKEVTVTEGPYKGFVGEEPEYEQLAAWGPMIGNTDLGAVVMLSNEVDLLGLDCNEASWTIAWVMECYDKDVFSKDDLDGLDLKWGNVEAVRAMLNKIAKREGIGDMLAEGVMRASRKIGGEAADWAIYTQKGSSPRSHDHRGRWVELFDTCMSNTSTIESSWTGIHPHLVDLPTLEDPFSHEEISTIVAKFNGVRQFDDCLGSCRLASPDPKLQLDCLNAVTGWELTLDDVFTIGRRAINQLRMFNYRHGLKKENERPSKRYGSVPVDGPVKGKNIMEKWDKMLENYYHLMGWDPETGKPLPETLKKLGLEELIKDL
ncbi:MAG: aldehyde ferredoxin oxidoreductase C-terminal domain-containing protein [Desulfobacterales bacterium]|nr:aldehyde ferredoxin oxidoreductase C-terminal domain-containing protein [Desulfobacterales bacterium]MDX2513549.1 aldehyde ferredoxin oxidoreductase C-terminal domain-containing protein [Desulfobacterales bacterium]